MNISKRMTTRYYIRILLNIYK